MPEMNAPWLAVSHIVCDADSIEVCKVPVWREGRADAARLIAAAPELLAVLETLLPEARGAMEDANEHGWSYNIDELTRPAYDAINKARGYVNA